MFGAGQVKRISDQQRLEFAKMIVYVDAAMKVRRQAVFGMWENSNQQESGSKVALIHLHPAGGPAREQECGPRSARARPKIRRRLLAVIHGVCMIVTIPAPRIPHPA